MLPKSDQTTLQHLRPTVTAPVFPTS